MTEFCTQVHSGKSYQITVKTDNKEHYLHIQQAARECVDNAPTIDAEPVRRGYWVAKKVMARTPFAINHYCSKCKFETDFCTNYCSNCGAKMDEEVEHEAD